MGQRDTPPSSPYMEEYVEELDENNLQIIVDDDVDILDSYEVEEGDEDGGEEMADEQDVVVAMEREDAICIFEKHISSVFIGSLSKDGKYAVTGGEDDKAYVWDTRNGEVILECTGHKDSVIFADFSYDDMYLATGDMNGIIQVRKTLDQSVIWDYSMGDATWMQWHPMAHILIAGSVEGEIYMWKLPEGNCKIVQGFGKRAECASLMSNGKTLAVGYEDGAIRVIDLKTCNVVVTIQQTNIGHTAAITSIDCHLDNNLILTAGVDGKTIISAANTGKIIIILQDLKGDSNIEEDASDAQSSKDNWVETVAFFKDSVQQHIAATGTLNGEIYIWDISKKTLRHKMDQGSGVTKLVWKNNSTLLFSAGLDGILRCFEGRTGELVRTFLGHTEDILDVYLSKDGKLALTTSDDTTARIFEIDMS